MGGTESTLENSRDGGNNSNSNGRDEVATQNRDEGTSVVGKAVAVAAAIGVVGVGVVGLLSGLSSDSEDKTRKTMKAPGRDQHIYRDDFERDPAAYFRGLRK